MLVLSANAVNTNNTGMMQMMGMRTGAQKHMMPGGEMMEDNMMEGGMSMSGMVEELKGKQGDEFDDEFTELMIEHHQGAIDMAKLAQQYAGHDEVKNLANDIITAQTNEIEMMKTWRQNWGFGN
jgi:uncharacterized protein (DUF305 family)